MKKKLLTGSIIGLVLLITCQLSNLLSFHRLLNNSLLPTVKPGRVVISTSVKNYTYGDFVCCSNPKGPDFYSRIIALEDDTVEYKDGYVLRNGFIADNPENILLSYFTRKPINDTTKFNWLSIPPEKHNDTTVFCLSFAEFKEVGRHFLLRNYLQSGVFQNKVEVIPDGHCLVAADNRSISNKQNHFKIIPLSAIKGVVEKISNKY